MFKLKRKVVSHQPALKQRREARMTMFGIVDLYDENGVLLANATMREISKTGAQLRLRSPVKLPKRIRICSSGNRQSYMATVKWVSGISFGVEFDEEVKVPKQRPNSEERVRVVTSHLMGKPVR